MLAACARGTRTVVVGGYLSVGEIGLCSRTCTLQLLLGLAFYPPRPRRDTSAAIPALLRRAGASVTLLPTSYDELGKAVKGLPQASGRKATAEDAGSLY